jgi:ubiquinol-cytochrome c reductase cytochrome b subunit
MANMLVGLRDWVDARLPITRAWDTHMGEYYAPKNFNFWYYFGVFSLLVLVNQLLTGIWLTMNYTASAEDAFASVEYIMRDVDYGWVLRYMHSTGASAFFVVVYLHMFRALIYGSYKKPRELIWVFGMLIFVVLMAEAFVGYVLPWGQMSYWGAQVIISLFGAIPVVGESIVTWIRGDYLISGITLNRFFALHVVALPIVLLALGRAAYPRIARGRVKQPGRRRNQEEQRARTACRWTVSASIPTTACTMCRRSRSSCSYSARSCSLCRKWAVTSSSTPTSRRPMR